MSKIEEARAAGYSDDEILSHMVKSKPKLTDALKEGYSATEILSHLGNKSAPAPQEAPAAPAAKQERSLGNAVATGITNLPSSISKVIGGTVDAVTSPVQTASSMRDLVSGAVLKIPGVRTAVESGRQAMGLPPEDTQRADNAVNSLVNSYKDKYGSWAGLKDSLAQDPAGILLDASAAFTGGATVAPKAGQVANALNKAAAVTNPLAPVQAITNKLASGGASVAGKAMDMGRKPELAAANIARQAAGDDLGLIQAANRANPDAPSSVAAGGVSGDTYQALAAKGGTPNIQAAVSDLTKMESEMMQFGDRLQPNLRADLQRRINARKAEIDGVNQNAAQAAAGEGSLNTLVRENTPSPAQLPRVPQVAKYIPTVGMKMRALDSGLRFANGALDLMQGKVRGETITKLSEGMRTGASANDLLASLPSVERVKVLELLKSNPKWLTNSGVNAMVQGANVLDQSTE